MKDALIDQFQYTIRELLVRNKSILDLISKFQDSCSRVNRSIIKSVTQCGCVEISAKKQHYPDIENFDELKNSISSHLDGALCENCVDTVEKELGNNLFYIASICNALDLNLYDLIIKELERTKMLGFYNLR